MIEKRKSVHPIIVNAGKGSPKYSFDTRAVGNLDMNMLLSP